MRLSTVLAWAQKQRKRMRESLEKAKVSVLGHSDWLSQTLLRIKETGGHFKGGRRVTSTEEED